MTSQPWYTDEDFLAPDYDLDDLGTEDSFQSDIRFGVTRQAERELNREMVKYSEARNVEPDWVQAPCYARVIENGVSDDLWFAPKNTTAAAEASRICFEKCPIRLQCLKFASTSGEPAGIWGGLGPEIRCNDRSPITNHDYEALKELPNPYDTTEGPYSPFRLGTWEPDTDTDADIDTNSEVGPEYYAPARYEILPDGNAVSSRFPGYAICPDGRVFGKTGLPLGRSFKKGTEGPRYTLKYLDKSVGVKVAVLVASAFLGYESKMGGHPHIKHINGDFNDCRAENLTWEGKEPSDTQETK